MSFGNQLIQCIFILRPNKTHDLVLLFVCGVFCWVWFLFLDFVLLLLHPHVWSLHCLNDVGNAVHFPLEIGMV